VKHANNCFAVYAVNRPDLPGPKLYVATIGKKIVKKSVDRSLIKRRIRAVFREFGEILGQKDVVIMTRSGVNELRDYSGFRDKLLELFKKHSVNWQGAKR
jgi:ribonuclease P protein component